MFGKGTLSYMGRNERNHSLHQACLELESRGLIYRFRSDGDCVLWMPVPKEPATPKHPGEFHTFCDRCKKYKPCLLVPYHQPPPLTPPELEPLIGEDSISYRPVIDYESARLKCAAMCNHCRSLKEKYKVEF
jgi:hypothetical protein